MFIVFIAKCSSKIDTTHVLMTYSDLKNLISKQFYHFVTLCRLAAMKLPAPLQSSTKTYLGHITKTQKKTWTIHMPIATQARLSDFFTTMISQSFPTFMTKNGYR